MTERQGDIDVRHQLDILARRERGRLVAGLLHRVGPANLALAEDVAQDAVLRALSVWPYRGIPDKPGAWLAKVAWNKALDRLRRENREQTLTDGGGPEHGTRSEAPVGRIADPELSLVFLTCHPALTALDRQLLTLKTVSGFRARDLADLFLGSEAAIAQRLSRAKRKLAALDPDALASPTLFELANRLPMARKAIYLLFSLGYSTRRGPAVLHRDVAMEAVRLARLLALDRQAGTSEDHALAALTSLHASRLAARQDGAGEIVLLRDQDRGKWDRRLIEDGLFHLERARQADVLTRYHLEAGIAAAHATASTWESCDWDTIARLYTLLERAVPTTPVIVNACVAEAMTGNAERALQRLDGLARDGRAVARFPAWHIARADVLTRLGRDREARQAYSAAEQGTLAAPTSRLIARRLADLP